jgi:hypothetical protein
VACINNVSVRFDAFSASEYNEVFWGYQLGEVVQFSRDQRFEDHLCPRPQGRRIIWVYYYYNRLLLLLLLL